ncbi:allophanate hydrolase [Paenibacillus glycanilyticus]|uniref:Allophanate hydrolase n=1 Tax=Paenibacillus glycanilyticus TaxID=126569 RepID=A0ABQ6NIF7_9BACL|nr:allophanate hydrolase [Paenibacillus glycanilyticus]GMK44254.1 allophanate hydrolase [Paenibacillus glycanilyticus]
MSKSGIPDKLTIEQLRELYASGALTPEAVVDGIMERVQADAGMNIWITPPTMESVQPYLDRLKGTDPESLPLWGIPFAIKDNIDVAQIPTTAACPAFAYTPQEHAAVVQRMIDAGAIPLGKTNLDQFATGLVGVRSPYGETHNALRPELISGGSSSGSAVAVARGHAAFAFGTDTAGSGRVPAALNNLVGYKPSLGAWPTKGVVPACASLDCVNVFAHSLADALEVDKLARGIHESDPWSRSIERSVSKLPNKVVLPSVKLQFYGPYAAEYEKAWEAAVERITKLGVAVEYIGYDFFSRAAALLYDGPWVAERWASLEPFVTANPGVTFETTERILRSGASGKHSAASVFKAMHQLQQYKLETKKLLKQAVMVMPTCGGTWTREQVSADPIGANSDMGRYTNHCNLLDLCAAAIPAGFAADELPFGITLFALAEEEALITGAAEFFLTGECGAANPPIPNSVTEQAMVPVAVCGLHMRGFPLEKQMLEHGAHFVREAATAAKYQMIKLPTVPAKPGLIKKGNGGHSIQLEVWEMPKGAFGAFTALIPAPLGIGKVELEDGTEIPGFICEGYAEQIAEDITVSGGWRYISV